MNKRTEATENFRKKKTQTHTHRRRTNRPYALFGIQDGIRWSPNQHGKQRIVPSESRSGGTPCITSRDILYVRRPGSPTRRWITSGDGLLSPAVQTLRSNALSRRCRTLAPRGCSDRRWKIVRARRSRKLKVFFFLFVFKKRRPMINVSLFLKIRYPCTISLAKLRSYRKWRGGGERSRG